jgi:predicted Zn-dependent protease
MHIVAIFVGYKTLIKQHRLKQKGENVKAAAVISQKFRFNSQQYYEEEGRLVAELKQDPDNIKLLTKLAKNCYIRGVHRTAESLLRRAIQLTGGRPVVVANMGYFLMQTGQEAEAEELLERVVREDPRCALAWCNLAELQMTRALRGRSAHRAAAGDHRSTSQEVARRRARAEEMFRTAIQADPRCVAHVRIDPSRAWLAAAEPSLVNTTRCCLCFGA